MKTNYQAVVAEYHVEEESSDLDLEDEEKEGLVSNSKQSKWSRQSHHLWGEGHQSFAMNAISSSDSDEGIVIAIVTPNSLFDLKKTKMVPLQYNFFKTCNSCSRAMHSQ